MAASSIVNLIMLPLLLLLGSSFTSTMATRKLNSLVESPPLALHYHNGALLAGKISVNLIWYGDFTAAQRGIVTDFLSSLHTSSTSSSVNPSVSAWWKTTEKYRTGIPSRRRLSLVLGQQVFDSGYSLGKSLSDGKIVELAARGGQRDCINVVLTAADVTVNRFCMDRCGSHGASRVVGGKKGRFAYVWVGNSETQCPGMCAWPFHQPVYGPQEPPLVAPNGDVGVDGMIISLAGMMAGAATNTFGDGYFQGSAEAPLEAATACPGVYGTGAFPGYTGKLLVDDATSGSYNANGENGRKFLLPALWDPSSSTCYTLI